MNHIGRKVTFEVGGKRYTLSRYTRRVLSRVVEWAASRLPHPLDAIKNRLDGFPAHLQERIVDAAIDSSKSWGSINNPEIQAKMNTEEGVIKQFQLLLQEHHPDITEDEVFDLIIACEEEHGQQFIADRLAETHGKLKTESEEGEGEQKKT